jgi:hypothetical protein
MAPSSGGSSGISLVAKADIGKPEIGTMSFDAADDPRLLHSLPNCLLYAVNDEPGCRMICDGIGDDIADITIEVDGSRSSLRSGRVV